MNKQEFIEWVKSLPDDFECLPIAYETTQHEDVSQWESDFSRQPMYYKAAVKKTVCTKMKLDVVFEGEVSAEFERDQFGGERWCNFKQY